MPRRRAQRLSVLRMLAALTIEHVHQPGYSYSYSYSYSCSYGNEFDVGLEVVLDGIATRLSGQRHASGTTWR